MSVNTSPRTELEQRVASYYSIADRASSVSAAEYLKYVVIDARPEPKAFRLIAEPWQWGLANKIYPAMESVAGVKKDYQGPRNFWYTLPRGHDKTSSIGRACSWALSYCRRPISGVVAAADKEQAGLILEFMKAEISLNPWLAKHLTFKSHEVLGANGSRLKVISADAFSSYGLKPDFVICDELTHWGSRDLFDALISGREKRPDSVFVVITNAGLVHSWQDKVLKIAQGDSRWFVYEAPGPIASWMNAEAVEAMCKMLPSSVAARVIRNIWIDPADEYGFVPKEDLLYCAEMGVQRALTMQRRGEMGIDYVGSIDYGPVKDRTVLTVGHMNKSGEILVDRMDVWQGSKSSRVSIKRVESWIKYVRERFNLSCLVVDPHQMESTIQKFSGSLNVVRYEARGGKANYILAECLRTLIVNHRLTWYPGCGDVFVNSKTNKAEKVRHTLTDEFMELITKVLSYGYRITHLPGHHDDRAVSLGMLCTQLVQVPTKRNLYMSDMFF